MPKSLGRVWMAHGILDFMVQEAKKHYPRETGGALVGYWVRDSEAVITDIIGPGPHSLHGKHRFIPDHAYQESELTERYERSGRIYVYLGDWHTHPDGSSSLSSKDKDVLLEIAQHSDARVTEPLMAVLFGETTASWKLKIWQDIRHRKRKIWQRSIIPLSIKHYEP